MCMLFLVLEKELSNCYTISEEGHFNALYNRLIQKIVVFYDLTESLDEHVKSFISLFIKHRKCCSEICQLYAQSFRDSSHSYVLKC